MDIKALVLGLAFAAMWSSAFTSARIIVAEAPPIGALALRFFISGLLAVVLARVLGQSWHLTRTQWRATVVFGVCQNAIYLGLNFVAMQTIEASLAAIIASSMPLLVAFVGVIALGERMSLLSVGGLLAGFSGVAIIMGTRLVGEIDLFGLALCCVGVVALTAATLSMRQASSGGNLLMIVGLQMLAGCLVLTPFFLLLETWSVTWTPRLSIAFAYTTLVPGLLATLVWFILVEQIGATRAATFHFLNPFFGVLVAFLILGEKMTLTDAIGVVVIGAGILAVQLAKLRPANSNKSV